jgi:cyclophilin family peptidyl-prolyl cis-trans isomerase
MMFHARLPMCVSALAVVWVTAVAAQRPPNPVVVVETNVGSMTIELFKDQAPRTVENFLSYARTGFYNGTIFHRVIKDFMIQGGGFTPQMRLKPTRPAIRNEATAMMKNERGTVAAARSAGVDSSTAQFFINTAQNVQLDHKSIRPDEYGYTVFGRVTEGMDVVDRIEHVKTDGNDVPKTLMMIMRVTLQEPR